MYKLQVREDLDKLFSRLAARNPKQMGIISKKVEEIRADPLRYKNLRAPLNRWRRVHIEKSFVLCFSVDEETQTVTLEDYDHHDRIYRN
jgi:YafQ family addiction module toxin component